MSDFDIAVNYVLRNEKGLIGNPHDNGKITKYGISYRFLKSLDTEQLRKHGIFEDPTPETIQGLSIDQAKRIYQHEFWNVAPFEKILNQDICNYIFDMAVSLGIAPAIKCAQRACWAVLKRRDLIDDGILGDKTLETIKRCDFLLMPAMRSERAGYYRLCVQHDSDEKEFINGWLNRAYEVKV